MAVINDHKDTIKFLLKHKVDTSKIDHNGDTAFIFAIKKGRSEICILFTQYAAEHPTLLDDKDSSGNTPFITQLEMCLTHSKNANYKATPALERSDQKILQATMTPKSKHTANSKGEYPIQLTVRYGNVTFLDLIINDGGHLPDIEMSMALYEDKESCTVKHKCALHIAAENGNVDMIQKLMQHGYKLECTDEHGNTPLHLACMAKNIASIELILQENRDVIDCRNKVGETPFHLAIRSGSEQAVNLFLQSNAPISATTERGETIVHYAALNNNFKVFELIMVYTNHRPILWQADFEGKTPLVCAVLKGDDSEHSAQQYPERAIELCALSTEENKLISSGLVSSCIESNNIRVLNYIAEKTDFLKSHPEKLSGFFKEAVELERTEIQVLLLREMGKESFETCIATHAEAISKTKPKELLLIKARRFSSARLEALCKTKIIEQQDLAGTTWLEKLVQSLDTKKIQVYLKHKKQDSLGNDACWYAAQNNKWQVIDTLKQSGVDLNSPNSSGETPLTLAIKLGHWETVNKLISCLSVEELTNSASGEESHVERLGKTENEECFRLALQKIGTQSPQMLKALFNSAAKNNLPQLYTFLRMIEGPMRSTVINENQEQLKQVTTEPPLIYRAHSEGHEQLMSDLIDAGLVDQTDLNGESALSYAVRDTDLTFVETLLDRGANYLLQLKKGQTIQTLSGYLGVLGMEMYLRKKVDGWKDKADKIYKRIRQQNRVKQS
ncbi:ankyrin repeat domain-containing protein [Shewanella sp. 202IG2-18]|nr:ankyrin repeat domain-containing protein [Parashewanella hymeniacidonis]